MNQHDAYRKERKETPGRLPAQPACAPALLWGEARGGAGRQADTLIPKPLDLLFLKTVLH